MNLQSQTSLSSGNHIPQVPQNQLEAFLYYMAKMDTGMLSEILEDNCTYQNTSKELFLVRLAEVMEQIKSWGKDSELIVIPGECYNERCNKGCRGYSFAGKCSGLHFDLIVENNNTQIDDIFTCSYFKTDSGFLDPEKYIFLEIYPDEKVDFNPDEEYLATLNQCNNACDEVLKNSSSVIDLNFVEQWLKKNEECLDKHREWMKRNSNHNTTDIF